jgi:hypothetical protein
MNGKRIMLVLASLLFACCEGSVQRGGTVVDADTGVPLAGAFVTLSVEGSDYPPDTTDIDGRFHTGSGMIGMVCGPPSCRLRAALAGYESTVIEFKTTFDTATVIRMKNQ